jgi:8-oxo-dGTP diphosphatase
LETWDLFNKDRQPLGMTHNRKDPMRPNQYHIVASIWTVNDTNEILITLRHPDKKEYPNYWENTAGSVLAGETSRAGAERELFEETGIKVEPDELVYLGTRREESAFIDSYIVRKNIPISSLKMQEGETASARWVSLAKLDEMMESGAIALPVAERLVPLRASFEKFLFSTK